MPTTECENCDGQHQWHWEEAFAKFGFNDGDGQVETWSVEAVLLEAWYQVVVNQWGLHNTVIVSIIRDDVKYIPVKGICFGYDNPRDYLPGEIIALLDKELPGEGPADFLF